MNKAIIIVAIIAFILLAQWVISWLIKQSSWGIISGLMIIALFYGLIKLTIYLGDSYSG